MAKTRLTDEHLIKIIINGESEKFEILIRRYSTELYKIARAFNLNHIETEALMEKNLCKCLQKPKPPPGKETT